MVALLDMDSFFAMIEIVRNPFLKDKPVAIIGWGERTAISSMNYAAKRYGVKVGMPPHMAKSLCPQIVFVKADFAEYESISLGIENLLCERFPIYIRYSIDEFFIDLNVPRYLERLIELKKEIKRQYKLTCSIGISPNPVLSKIACEFSKPDGFLIVEKEKISEFLQDLDVSSIPGIGRKTQEYLRKIKINRVKELVDFAKRSVCPKTLAELVESIFTIDFDRKEFFKKKPPKSFGHMKTLDVNITSLSQIKEIGFYLLYRAFLRMIREGYRARTVSLILRYHKFQTISLSRSLKEWSSNFLRFAKVLEMLIESAFNYEPVRMLGVSLSNLKPFSVEQLELFSNHEKLLKAMSVKNLEISSKLFLT